METGFYTYYNVALPRIGCGWRSVFALVGKRKAILLDWATGDTAKVDVRELKAARPDAPRKLVVSRCLHAVADVRRRRAAEKGVEKEKVRYRTIERSAISALGRSR